jgi:hypothetical protein
MQLTRKFFTATAEPMIVASGNYSQSLATLSVGLLLLLLLRLGVVHRMTDKVTQVGPYRIPAGVIVFPCLYSILMHSSNWDNPRQVGG